MTKTLTRFNGEHSQEIDKKLFEWTIIILLSLKYKFERQKNNHDGRNVPIMYEIKGKCGDNMSVGIYKFICTGKKRVNLLLINKYKWLLIIVILVGFVCTKCKYCLE